jgi:hypothetical protein
LGAFNYARDKYVSTPNTGGSTAITLRRLPLGSALILMVQQSDGRTKTHRYRTATMPFVDRNKLIGYRDYYYRIVLQKELASTPSKEICVRPFDPEYFETPPFTVSRSTVGGHQQIELRLRNPEITDLEFLIQKRPVDEPRWQTIQNWSQQQTFIDPDVNARASLEYQITSRTLAGTIVQQSLKLVSFPEATT